MQNSSWHLLCRQTLKETVDLYKVQPKRSPRIKVDRNFQIEEIRISVSLLKKMFFRGDLRDFCPLKLYHLEILRDYQEPPTINMLRGLYFETHCIGSTADGSQVLDLPRLRNGAMGVDQIRINEQIAIFPSVCESLGIIVDKTGRDFKNVQLHKTVSFSQYKKTDGVNILLAMGWDLVSPITYGGIDYPAAIIDIKLAENVNTNFGEYCWGKPELMDHTQAFIYSFFGGLPFFYLLFDYYSKGASHKLLPVNTNMDHSDPAKAGEARVRFRETIEMINLGIAKILSYHANGWNTNPTLPNCKTCPILHCTDRNKNQDI